MKRYACGAPKITRISTNGTIEDRKLGSWRSWPRTEANDNPGPRWMGARTGGQPGCSDEVADLLAARLKSSSADVKLKTLLVIDFVARRGSVHFRRLMQSQTEIIRAPPGACRKRRCASCFQLLLTVARAGAEIYRHTQRSPHPVHGDAPSPGGSVAPWQLTRDTAKAACMTLFERLNELYSCAPLTVQSSKFKVGRTAVHLCTANHSNHRDGACRHATMTFMTHTLSSYSCTKSTRKYHLSPARIPHGSRRPGMIGCPCVHVLLFFDLPACA